MVASATYTRHEPTPEELERVLSRVRDRLRRLLAHNAVAFSPYPGSSACRHHSCFPRLPDEQSKRIFPQIKFHTSGNRTYSRSRCRHCLVGFEDQWGIAVSGGH